MNELWTNRSQGYNAEHSNVIISVILIVSTVKSMILSEVYDIDGEFTCNLDFMIRLYYILKWLVIRLQPCSSFANSFAKLWHNVMFNALHVANNNEWNVFFLFVFLYLV